MMFGAVAKVCLVLVLLGAVAVSARYASYPEKTDKWAIECETVADCEPCQLHLITICLSGYCGCKYPYHFGG